LTYLHSFLQFSSLPPSKLNCPFRYPGVNKLTDNEEEMSSPKRHKSSPIAEEERQSHKGPMAEELAATVHHGAQGAGGCIHGLGKRIISRRPSQLYAAI
jgi:hypothetical protein